MITRDILKQITGIESISKLDELVIGLNEVLSKYNINTKLRIAHFLAQIMHESNNLNAVRENLNYSTEGLLKVFPKYFNSITARQYARNPQAIANKVYANRMGNGTESSGDGWKYRGIGPIQLTGKNNLDLLSKDTGINFISDPELLVSNKYLFLSAAWYWNKNNLNKYADLDNLDAISDIINLGHITSKSGDSNGYTDRFNKLNKIKNILK